MILLNRLPGFTYNECALDIESQIIVLTQCFKILEFTLHFGSLLEFTSCSIDNLMPFQAFLFYIIPSPHFCKTSLKAHIKRSAKLKDFLWF